MYSTLLPGTTLQNRYRIVRELGHGGFGHTYEAEDIGRFNEKCAVKELKPQQGGEFSDKALQLFQREANILYNINHPQIPKFQAIFEENQRLFLVQDYIDGITYRDLLTQRQQQGMVFSEAEVRQFLRQLLPVLAHIHSKGIIHRDISPDNVMQRRADGLPVLIDFGVVKEVVTRLQTPDSPSQFTSVGKPGYAPSEQMQSGRAYPSSDLYALAVTAIVLLTGQEPDQLFDDQTLSWRLPQSLSPGLVQVLQRATSYRPGDRYQSVSEMAQALGTTSTAVQPPPAHAPSQVKTVAVGRQYQPTQAVPVAPPTYAAPGPLPPTNDTSLWENPWAVAVIGGALALLAGLGGWTVVSLLNRPPAPVPSPEITIAPTPIPSPEPTPEPTPEPSPETSPVEYDQNLAIDPGTSRTVTGSLRRNETINYRFNALEGQTLAAGLTGEGVLMTVLTPSGQPVNRSAQRVLNWQGTLPADGEYILQLRPVQGLEQSDFELEVSLGAVPDPSPDPTPEPTVAPPPPITPLPEPIPDPTAPPTVIEQRVQIPPGQTTVQVSGQVNQDRGRRYIISAQAGQVLSLELPTVSGPATLDVRFPGGELVPDAARVLSWQGQLPIGGDYLVDVNASRPSSYTLRVSVE